MKIQPEPRFSKLYTGFSEFFSPEWMRIQVSREFASFSEEMTSAETDLGHLVCNHKENIELCLKI